MSSRTQTYVEQEKLPISVGVKHANPCVLIFATEASTKPKQGKSKCSAELPK